MHSDGPTPAKASTSSNVRQTRHSFSPTSNNTYHDLKLNPDNKHVRSSIRGVRNDIYEAMADLSAYNFSYREMQIALMIVAKRFLAVNKIIC